MKKIGITGGIGCGKSFALEVIKEEGYQAIDADDLTRELWQDESVVGKIGSKLYEYGYLKEEFTAQAVRAVAKNAFKDMQVINALERVLQPMILDKLSLWMKEKEKEGEKVVFVIVPLLFECGLQYLFDETVTINVDNEIRERRLQLSRPLSAADINLRFNRQWANWARSHYANYTIENNGTKEEFKEAIKAFLREKL
ncbi:dephospho-CoA kinase [bacterium]|nr:dephospho-CoA kinase [bacterium]